MRGESLSGIARPARSRFHNERRASGATLRWMRLLAGPREVCNAIGGGSGLRSAVNQAGSGAGAALAVAVSAVNVSACATVTTGGGALKGESCGNIAQPDISDALQISAPIAPTEFGIVWSPLPTSRCGSYVPRDAVARRQAAAQQHRRHDASNLLATATLGILRPMDEHSGFGLYGPGQKLREWYASLLGQSMLDEVDAALAEMLHATYGYHALQIGIMGE